jgi:hypothetical protein
MHSNKHALCIPFYNYCVYTTQKKSSIQTVGKLKNFLASPQLNEAQQNVVSSETNNTIPLNINRAPTQLNEPPLHVRLYFC